MHLNTTGPGVIKRAMTKRRNVEVRAKLAIKMAQYVQIERCGYALRIVVSRIQYYGSFFKSTPISAPPPAPRSGAHRSRNARASSTVKLPIVDPGK